MRELENLITRACVLTTSETIAAAELRPWLQEGSQECRSEAAPAGPNGDKSTTDLAEAPLAEVERQVILATLDRFDGHRGRAAESLGIGVRTLSGKLRAYGYAPRARSFGHASNEAARQNLPLASADSAGRASKRSV